MRSPESVTIGTGGALAEKNKAVKVTSALYLPSQAVFNNDPITLAN